MGYKMPYMMHVIGKYCIKIVSKVAKAVAQNTLRSIPRLLRLHKREKNLMYDCVCRSKDTDGIFNSYIDTTETN